MAIAGALAKETGAKQQTYVKSDMAVRRLTPMECERLQGFPDGYTAITYNRKSAKDGPRYKALGNSMAVPVMAWIGRRIQQVTGHHPGCWKLKSPSGQGTCNCGFELPKDCVKDA